MSKKINYYMSDFFTEEFQKLIKQKQSFEFHRTSYTKKLKTKNRSIIFNPEGTGDDKVLSLINKVRNDAKKYMAEHENEITYDKIYFVDVFELPKEEEIIMKVDLSSAYWRFACLQGIISEETQKYFNETFSNRDGRELKSIRLKALGSLATKKEIETFENGVSIDWDIEEQPTKILYMFICKRIDDVMRECFMNCQGCIFYYWDCMFVRKQYSKEVINFFKSKNFECKTEETRLSYDTIGNKGYFTSEVDGKMYMVISDNKDMLKQFDKQQLQ